MALAEIKLLGLDGVNLLADPTSIKDTESAWAQNIFPKQFGIPGTRDAMTWQRNVVHQQDTHPPVYLGDLNSLLVMGMAGAYTLWQQSRAYAVGAQVVNNANIYICTVAGTSATTGSGPVTTGAGITDGSVTWNYVSTYLAGLAGPLVPVDFVFTDVGAEIVVVATDTSSGISYLLVLPTLSTYTTQCVALGELGSRPTLLKYRGAVYCFTGNDTGWVVKKNESPPLVLQMGVLDNTQGLGGNSRPGRSYIESASQDQQPWKILAFGFSTTKTGTNDTNGGIRPKFACIRNDRMVFANFGGQFSNALFFSDPGQPATVFPDQLSTNGAFFSLPDDIVAVREVAMHEAGSPGQSALFIWTRKNLYYMLGDPIVTTDLQGLAQLGSSQAVQVVKMNVAAGCAGHGTICDSPYGLFWASEEDVWFMPRGSIPVRVGTKISPALRNTPAALTWKWHAAFYKKTYRLAVFAPGQGPTSLSACWDQWWLDLRKSVDQTAGPQNPDEAVWWGPQRYVPSSASDRGTYCMQVDDRQESTPQLLGLHAFRQPYMDGAGIYYQGISFVGFDDEGGRDSCAPQGFSSVWTASTAYAEGAIMIPLGRGNIGITSPMSAFICTTGGNSGLSEPTWSSAATGPLTDGTVVWQGLNNNPIGPNTGPWVEGSNYFGGSEIVPVLRSKEFILGDATSDKLCDAMELGYWASQPWQAGHTRIIGGTQAQVVSLSNLGATPVIEGDATLLDNVSPLVLRSWLSRLLPPTPAARAVGPSMQIQLTHTPGIYIDPAWGPLTVIVSNSLNNFDSVTIPSGWYANVCTLLTAMKSAFVSALGVYGLSSLDTSWDTYLADPVHSPARVFGMKHSGTPTQLNIPVQVGGWSGITEAQCLTNRRIMRVLGYNMNRVNTSIAMFLGSYTYAENLPTFTQPPILRFANLQLRYRIFKRQPQ